jgi:hypothetical protein
MLIARKRLYWWAKEARISEDSYFRQLTQRWRTASKVRRKPSVSVAAALPVAPLPNPAANENKTIRTTYTVYWTDAGVTEAEFLVHKRNVHSAEHNELDEALVCARRVSHNMGIVWLINCSDGTRLTKSSIDKLVRRS